MRIVFATNNANKMSEVRAMAPQVEFVSLKEVGCTEEIPETGETLEYNSMEKAAHVRDRYKVDCISEDTGLEIEALNGKPGVHTAYYGGVQRSADANMSRVMHELQDVASRKARFRTVFTLLLDGEEHQFEGICPGRIAIKRSGTDGFGYDPIFIPDEQEGERSFAEMSQAEKAAISHRGRGLRKVLNFLQERQV